MRQDITPKNVYIIGNDKIGFHGHTYFKEDAKNILKYRKNFKMFKIPNNQYCKENLSINTEFLNLDYNIYMTADEEEFYIESVEQFKIDALYYIDILFKNIKYFNLNDKEKTIVKELFLFLMDYKNFMLEGQYTSDIDDGEIFNTEKSMKWFIDNVLDK